MNDVPAPLLAAATVALATSLLGPAVRAVLRQRGHEAAADDLAALRWPVRCAAAALVARVGVEPLGTEALATAGTVVLLATVAWALVRVSWVGQQVLFRRWQIDVADNKRARSRRTQIDLVRRILVVAVVLVTAAVAVVTLTPLGELGRTVVAYAGLVGVVLGLALRAPLENLAAGVVVATTEPIRIDDVVVVEGEWGRVEQIGLVNVVVRLWDDRRLVTPTSRFVQEPFENWTKDSAHVTGTVTMWVDHGVDVAELRRELEVVVAASPRWDGRLCLLQVVELGERAVQLRALVTARNAQDSWDLRCDVREGLLGHLHGRPGTLPVLRLDERAPLGAGSPLG